MQPQTNVDNLRAAIRLLEDPDPRIQDACRKKLLESAVAARPLLMEASRSDNAHLRARVRIVLAMLDRRVWLDAFIAFAARHPFTGDQRQASGDDAADRNDIDLETGVLAIARFGNPALRDADVTPTLDQWAAELRPRVAGKSLPSLAAELRRFFHQEKGLAGNHSSYFDPENSFLDQVLRRRKGIPIALSAIYLLVGRRIGVQIEGVGMPGHFLVRLRGPRSLLIDPFNGGQVLTRADCISYLRTEGFGFSASHLDAVDSRHILARMLSNLRRVYGYREDAERIALLTAASNALFGTIIGVAPDRAGVSPDGAGVSPDGVSPEGPGVSPDGPGG